MMKFLKLRTLVVLSSIIIGLALIYDAKISREKVIFNQVSSIIALNNENHLSEHLDLEHIDRSLISLKIEKSKGQLIIFYDQQPIKTYPIVLGKSPTGDKRQEGDYKTPEGIFSIRDKYPHPDWSKFLWLDYPTAESWEKHLKAKQMGQIEPDATIGGEIGIHGVPAGQDRLIAQGTNWTWGCIALKNTDIDEIYQFLQKGTSVEIRP